MNIRPERHVGAAIPGKPLYVDFPSVVLEYGRCSWGKCYFCGWGKRESKNTLEDLKRKYERFLERSEGAYGVKIFSSGSHLDPNQYPREFIRWLLDVSEEHGIREIVLESRPEFVTDETLSQLGTRNTQVCIAMGLEAADDEVLAELYNKGFTVGDYIRAAKTLRSRGFLVRTYLLVNGHPHLYARPEKQKEILRRSLEVALEHSDSVVIINAYPHSEGNLIVDWIEGRWRPLDRGQFHKLVEEALSGYECLRARDDVFLVKHDDRYVEVDLDFNNFGFVPKIPRRLWTVIKGVGKEVLLHPHFEVWQDYFCRFYEPPEGKEYILFLPCTYRKPYKRSRTHRAILRRISGFPWFKKLHLIVVSTPGVVPYEFHNRYPFTHYDWPEWEETEEVKRDYIEITKERVKRFLERHGHRYKRFFAFFHLESETLQAIIEACRELDMWKKLVVVLDRDTYEKIKEEIGKAKVGSSVVAHPLAIEKLIEVIQKYVD